MVAEFAFLGSGTVTNVAHWRSISMTVQLNLMPEVVSFTKISLPYGWLGNMSRYMVTYDEARWPTCEHLFQALRFEYPAMRNIIKMANSPMGAKMYAKAHASMMKIKPRSDQDVDNMELVLRLKIKDNGILAGYLLDIPLDATIVEDVTKRPSESGLFWGAKRTDDGWVGTNTLGKLWMKLRREEEKRVTRYP